MSRLAEFIRKNPAETALIKTVIDLYEKDRHEWEQNRCQICGKSLTIEERKKINSSHYWRTCSQHEEFATTYQIPLYKFKDRPLLKDFLFGKKS